MAQANRAGAARGAAGRGPEERPARDPRAAWDPDEMQGVRDALDEAGFDASWVGGSTITVREAP